MTDKITFTIDANVKKFMILTTCVTAPISTAVGYAYRGWANIHYGGENANLSIVEQLTDFGEWGVIILPAAATAAGVIAKIWETFRKDKR